MLISSLDKKLLESVIRDNILAESVQKNWDTNSQAETFLINSNKIKEVGTVIGKNSFTIQSRTNKNNPAEIYTFYADNSMWALRNGVMLFWNFVNSKQDASDTIPGYFEIYTDKERKKRAGTIKINPNHGEFTFYDLNGKAQGEVDSSGTQNAEEDEWSWSDIGHLILDIVGFVPVIGDIGDIVNAIWYWSEGKTFDAILSAIAIIPVVGSPIKFGLKGAAKAFTQIVKNINNYDNVLEFWRYVKNSGILNQTQIDRLGRWFTDTAEHLGKNQSTIFKQVPGDARKTMGAMDEMNAFFRLSGKSIDDLTGAAKKLADTKPSFGSMLAIRNEKLNRNIFQKLTSIGTLGASKRLGNIFRSAGYFPEKKVAAIAQNMENMYRKSLDNDPAKLFALWSTTPGFSKVASKPGTKLNFYKYLENLKSSRPNEYKDIVDSVFTKAKEQNNIFWELYKKNELSQLSAGLNVKLLSDPNLLKMAADFRGVKKLDVVWNEVDAIFEDLGLRVEDGDREQVFYPLLASMLNEYFPAGAEMGKQAGEVIKVIGSQVKLLWNSLLVGSGAVDPEELYTVPEYTADLPSGESYYEYDDEFKNEAVSYKDKTAMKEILPLIIAMTPGETKQQKLRWTLSHMTDPKIKRAAEILFSPKKDVTQ